MSNTDCTLAPDCSMYAGHLGPCYDLDGTQTTIETEMLGELISSRDLLGTVIDIVQTVALVTIALALAL